MKIEYDFVPNLKTMTGLQEIPDYTIRLIARQTLDMADPLIPYDTGKMYGTSYSKGVRGSKGNYYIGSYTSYASDVWEYPDNTHWTKDGTNNRWFDRAFKRYGRVIMNNAVAFSWRRFM